MRRAFILGAALAALLATPVLASGKGNGNNGNGNGNQPSNETVTGFAGWGSFSTQGQALAGSAFGGQAESFANGSAGLTFSQCGTCGGATFQGWQNNEAGALTMGNALALGVSQGAAQGHAFGGFASRNR